MILLYTKLNVILFTMASTAFPLRSKPFFNNLKPAFILFLSCCFSVLPAQTDSLPAVLDSAVTRDATGNGYLDEIELYFNAPVTFPPGFSLYNFRIYYMIKTITANVPVNPLWFTAYDIEAMDSSGTKFILHLIEYTGDMPGFPQTSWEPKISIDSLNNPVPEIQCKDGAGPVIWSVTKIIKDVSDRRQDIVDVTFSEPLQGPNGLPFTPATVKPGSVLIDYRKNENGAWDTITMVDSINSFDRMLNDSTLEFTMSNGKDLTANDYININAAANQIYDSRTRTGGGAGVPPLHNNRKVQVQVKTNMFPDQIIIFPNPSWPTNGREKAGYFYLTNNPHARDWVRMDASGIVINFQVFISADDSTVCSLKIYDSFGTEVASADPYNGNYLRNIASVSDTPQPKVSNELVNVDIYWNGTTTKLPVEFVHEGIYLAKFQYQRKNDTRPTVLEEEVYMKKTDVGHSTCGGNVTIAFVPAVWLKTRRTLLKIIKALLKKQKLLC